MVEHVTPAEYSLVEGSPLVETLGDEYVNLGGNIQLNLKCTDGTVLHVSPAVSGLSNSASIICQRWFFDNKPLKLAEAHVLAGTLHSNVRTPRVVEYGAIDSNGRSYPYWFDTYATGEKLSSLVFTRVGDQPYTEVLSWLGRLHSFESVGENLRDHYLGRLDAFTSFLRDENFVLTIGVGNTQRLLETVLELQSKIEQTVELTENVSWTHGDLHGDNVLVLPDGVITVLDFEQGIMGGDWFSDIAKLLVPESDSLPDSNKPHKYFPPFGITTKRKLMGEYCKARSQNGWPVPALMANYVATGDATYIRDRIELSQFDNMMSVLVMRHLLGWNFYVDQENNRRGTEFILHLMKEKYGWE